jgi:high-affinity nickel permease
LFDVAALDALPLALAGTSFALGARHGLDWDHIAAITDLTAPRAGTTPRPGTVAAGSASR